MSRQISIIKHKLTEAIMQLCEVSWMFVKKPGRDFIATSSAFVQQRGKIDPSAFSALFDLFVQKQIKKNTTKVCV